MTNPDLAGNELIWWCRQQCGVGEEAHVVLKEDLVGGPVPSRTVWGKRSLVGHGGAGL